jgi:outer membrane protein OmpA-like peptidoglycan-associated protein
MVLGLESMKRAGMMMQERIEETIECTRSALRRGTYRVGAMILVMGLTACSSLPVVPDYANPVVWYQSTTDMVGEWFTDDRPKIEPAGASKKSDDFPNLGSVPEKPTAHSTSQERMKLKNELVADRANAKYSNPVSTGGTKTVPATTGAAKISAVKPAVRKAGAETMVPTVTKAPAQKAHISSSPYVGKRSSLWPNAPAPALSVVLAATSDKRRPQAAAPTDRIAKPLRATSVVSVLKLTNSALANAAATSAVAPAVVTAPRVPEATPKFMLTPPTASQIKRETPSGSTPAPMLQFKLPVNDNGGRGGGDGQQLMLSFDSERLDGADGTINFRHGSARLSSLDLGVIVKMAQQALDAGAFIRVVGHASMRTVQMDPFEHIVANFNISLLRANAVAAALIQNGMPAERLIVDALGDTQPLYSEAMPSGEHANRRTEIFLKS